MIFLVCGLGSMGRRRIRLLKQIVDIESVIGFDLSEDRCKIASEEFGIKCFNDLSNIADDAYDCVVVSTGPLAHGDLVKFGLNKKKHVFTEINLIDDWYDECVKIAQNNDVKLFMSSTLNYREDIKYIKNIVHESLKKSTYIYHVGQYLPDWHPWENYKNYFVADKRTNGCRELMAIDIPWIYNVFGSIKNIQTVHSKISQLELPYDDSYANIINHKNGNFGTIVIDVVSRKPVRSLEVINEDFYISWQGRPDSLFITRNGSTQQINTYEEIDKNSNYSPNIIENAYKDELIAFLDYIKVGKKPIYGFDEDKVIIDLINNMEK